MIIEFGLKKHQRSLADLSVNRVIIVAGLWPCIVFLKTLNELQCYIHAFSWIMEFVKK